jgi:hypothetical protein
MWPENCPKSKNCFRRAKSTQKWPKKLGLAPSSLAKSENVFPAFLAPLKKGAEKQKRGGRKCPFKWTIGMLHSEVTKGTSMIDKVSRLETQKFLPTIWPFTTSF